MDHTETFIQALIAEHEKIAEAKDDKRVRKAARGLGMAAGAGYGLHSAMKNKMTGMKAGKRVIGGGIVGGVAGHLAGNAYRHLRAGARNVK